MPMAAAQVTIDHLSARYRVPTGEPGTVAWLDQLLSEVVRRHLAAALATAGLDRDGHVCVRSVVSEVTVRPEAGDAVNVRAWVTALTAAVAAAVQRGDAVVYRDDAAVLEDVIRGGTVGDVSRRWAWQQTGVVSPQLPAAPAALVLAAVATRGEQGLAVLRGAATADTALVAALGWPAWVALSAPPHGVRPFVGDPPPAPLVLRARRALEADRLAAALARLARRCDPPTREVAQVAGLALRLADPAHPVAAHDDVTLAAILLAAPVAAADRAVGDGLPEAGSARPESGGRSPSDRQDIPASGRTAASSAATRDAEESAPAASATRESPGDVDPTRRIDTDTEPVAPTRDGEPAGRAPQADAEGDGRRPACASSSVGGLLFLLHLVVDLDVAGRTAEPDHPLCGRPLPWTLHALARDLTGTSPDDPAVLAFAGVGPGGEPPSSEAPGPRAATPAERRAVRVLGDELAVALAGRLGPDPDEVDAVPDGRVSGDAPPSATGTLAAARSRLRETCRRDTTIVAEPGWIEAHLRLDEVDLAVRRAGLDLDPGFVTCLGLVVRFVYG